MNEKEFETKIEEFVNDPDFGSLFEKYLRKANKQMTKIMLKEQIIKVINKHPEWFNIYLGVYDSTKFLVMAEVLRALMNGTDIQINARVICPEELETKVRV